MRNVAVQPEALREVGDAFEWYGDKDPGLGFRFYTILKLFMLPSRGARMCSNRFAEGIGGRSCEDFHSRYFLNSMKMRLLFIQSFIVREIRLNGRRA